MDERDEKMFFAGMALMGLVIKGQNPVMAAKMAWEFADHMYEQKPRQDNN